MWHRVQVTTANVSLTQWAAMRGLKLSTRALFRYASRAKKLAKERGVRIEHLIIGYDSWNVIETLDTEPLPVRQYFYPAEFLDEVAEQLRNEP